jgi:hypothetical protein
MVLSEMTPLLLVLWREQDPEAQEQMSGVVAGSPSLR